MTAYNAADPFSDSWTAPKAYNYAAALAAKAAATVPVVSQTMAADVNANSHRITNLLPGHAPGDAVRLDWIQKDHQEYHLNGASPTLRYNQWRETALDLTGALTSGKMHTSNILLYDGDVVTNITFISGATAAVAPTHWWYALYSTAATPVLLGQTADQTTAAWAAYTAKTVPLAAPYTVTTGGIYTIAVMVAAGTVPTLLGRSVSNVAVSAGFIAGQLPLAQSLGTGLTTTAPADLTGAVSDVNIPYVIVT